MKKLIFVLGFVLLVFSCNVERKNQKITKASQVDTVLVADGHDNEIKIPVKGFGFYSVSPDLGYIPLDSLFESSEDYEDFIRDQFRTLQYHCRHPRTFIPEKIEYFKVLDTLSVDFQNIKIRLYTYQVFVSGMAKNSFGVEGDVRDIIGTETTGDFISERIYDEDGDKIYYYITKFGRNNNEDEYNYYVPFKYKNNTYYISVSKRDIDFQDENEQVF